MKMLNNINKTEISYYENLVNDSFLIDNNLHSKKINRNKIVKVAKVIMSDGKSHYIYHTIRTTKYTPGTDKFNNTKNYINIYRNKVDKMLG